MIFTHLRLAFEPVAGFLLRKAEPGNVPDSDARRRSRSQAAVLTIGNFDGVHLGHVAMLGQLKELSRQLGLPAVVVTFDPPPLAILAPERLPPRLTTAEQKVSLLRAQGVDEVIVWPASRELLSLTAEQFFEQIVCDQLQCRGIVEGPNFCFGRARGAMLRS